MTCQEITMVVRTYQVCALTMFAQSQHFRVIVFEHKLDMSIVYGNYFQKQYYTVRMFALVSIIIIYTRITMVGQHSDIREQIDYLGTSKMAISWLFSKHSIYVGLYIYHIYVVVAAVVLTKKPRLTQNVVKLVSIVVLIKHPR